MVGLMYAVCCISGVYLFSLFFLFLCCVFFRLCLDQHGRSLFASSAIVYQWMSPLDLSMDPGRHHVGCLKCFHRIVKIIGTYMVLLTMYL